MNVERVFKVLALPNKGHFDHFGVHPKTASMYGHKVEDIVELEMEIADDQERVDHEGVDYWGFWDFEYNRWSLIYPKLFLLDMCFPYGIKAEETRMIGDGYKGKAYRLLIKNILQRKV